MSWQNWVMSTLLRYRMKPMARKGLDVAKVRAATAKPAVAMKVPGARGIEKCFARKTGLRYHVDLHLEVDPEITVRASHEIASRVRDRIRQQLPWVADVLVHVEPWLG